MNAYQSQGVWHGTRCIHDCHESGAASCDACQHMHPAKRQEAQCLPGRTHYWLRESDGVRVCQICGDIKQAQASTSKRGAA